MYMIQKYFSVDKMQSDYNLRSKAQFHLLKKKKDVL